MKKQIESKNYMKVFQRKYKKGIRLNELFREFEKAESKLKEEFKKGNKILIR